MQEGLAECRLCASCCTVGCLARVKFSEFSCPDSQKSGLITAF